MAKQTFTAGQVLTAAQMTSLQANDYNWTTSAQTASYVLTAANAGQTVTMTSASATTITVNTGLFTAGDRVNILNLGAGACTITAGTATVNTAGSLVLPQYGSGTLWFSSASAAIFIPDDRNAGLTLITAQTIGSAVSSVTVTGAFSSTYDNYKILINGGDCSSACFLRIQLGSATSLYYGSATTTAYSTASFSGSAIDGASSFLYAGFGVSGQTLAMNCDVLSPNLAKWTLMSASQVYNSSAASFGTAFCRQESTTQFTAFTISPSTGTLTGGTIRVYGYQNS